MGKSSSRVKGALQAARFCRLPGIVRAGGFGPPAARPDEPFGHQFVARRPHLADEIIIVP